MRLVSVLFIDTVYSVIFGLESLQHFPFEIMPQHNHFVYILTNLHRTVLYKGVTSNLSGRIYDHENGRYPGFTKKYNCRYLIYYERFQFIQDAIAREKQIKGWLRIKKERLISGFNPEWRFLNDQIKRW